ncbi:hypothetical protein H8D91_00520 [archaeon]|nr:hypothetical protein [archaeon]
MLEDLFILGAGLGTGLILLIFWEAVWKAIALWKTGRHNQLAWFVFILIFNTAGILPIVYLLFFQSKPVRKKVAKKVTKKKK